MLKSGLDISILSGSYRNALSSLYEHMPTISKENVSILNLQKPRRKMEDDVLRRAKAGENDGGNEDRSRNGI